MQTLTAAMARAREADLADEQSGCEQGPAKPGVESASTEAISAMTCWIRMVQSPLPRNTCHTDTTSARIAVHAQRATIPLLRRPKSGLMHHSEKQLYSIISSSPRRPSLFIRAKYRFNRIHDKCLIGPSPRLRASASRPQSWKASLPGCWIPTGQRGAPELG